MAKHAGKIHSISTSHDGKHVTVEVIHGRKKPSKKGAASSSSMDFYDRPRSSMMMPKADAAGFSVGQRVHAGIDPRDEEADEEYPDDESAEAPAVPAKKANPFMAKAKHGVADVGTSSSIKSAMVRRLARGK